MRSRVPMDRADSHPPISLAALARGWARVDPSARDVRITRVTADSREVAEGSLFVAVRGTRTDGHAFVDEAVRRGAAAVVVEHRAVVDVRVPTLRVEDGRRALAHLAAAWHGGPAERLPLVGITGTLGKTTVLGILEAILIEDGIRPGAIGSLGARVAGSRIDATGHTSPDPLRLHAALARMVEERCDLAAMEVTSHSLAQDRVHGLSFALGVFTNLVPLEHSDYHPTFGDYVAAKRRFLEHLDDCAPLVFNADVRAVRRLVHRGRVTGIGCGTARTAVARVEEASSTVQGTSFVLHLRRPLPTVVGGEVPPARIPLRSRLLGRSNVSNAALAATAALCLGADPPHLVRALATFPPPWRRTEVVYDGEFAVLDDTVGHPDGVSALFELIDELRPRRVHAVLGVRGQRGARINRNVARALAIWTERHPIETVVVTRAAEAADARNRVEEGEHLAFLRPLADLGVRFLERDRLDEAVRTVLERAGSGDLVLLLGAQGMDGAQRIARDWIAARADEPGPA